MVIDEEILETLRCPAAGVPLAVMTGAALETLNRTIAQGRAVQGNGSPVTDPLTAGLASTDGSSVYRIDEGTPILLPELRITASPTRPAGATEDPSAASEGIARVWEGWAERWTRLQPPARPAPEDVELFESLVAEPCAAAGSAAPRALLLGVTPEVATMRWPARTRLLALDVSAAMIRQVWPRERARNATVARANWRTMPVADAAYDVVVGDGVLLWQSYPDGMRSLAAEARRVLKRSGALVMRLFVKPERTETLEAVFDDLRRSLIPNSAALHLRLGMAIHRDVRTGIRLGDVWDAWHANVPDEEGLLSSLGWPPAMIGTFEVYRGNEYRLAYPTVAELADLFAGSLRLTECRVPAYDRLGMAPTAVFRPSS